MDHTRRNRKTHTRQYKRRRKKAKRIRQRNRRVAAFLLVLIFILGMSLLNEYKIKTMDAEKLGIPKVVTGPMIAAAMDASKRYDVPASVTIAQIIQESSGKYKDGLSMLAYEYKNLFGVKGKGPKGSVSLETREYNESGEAYTVEADFRVYSTYRQSIMDHGILLSGELYRGKTKGIDWKNNLEDWVYAMGSVYATDPGYADSLLHLIYKYDLQRFDQMELQELSSSLYSFAVLC